MRRNTPAREIGTRVMCNGYPGTITRVCEWSDALVEVRLSRGTVCVDIAECDTLITYPVKRSDGRTVNVTIPTDDD